MLESMDQLDSDYIRDILDACHVYFTQYSNIFDLRQKTLLMFHQGDYSMDVQLSFDQIMQEITAPMRISELMSITSVEDDPTVVPLLKSFGLLQNYPNPFNLSTKITFDLPGNVGEKLDATLVIFDIRGRRVRGLIDSRLEAGSHRVQWDGRNDRGEPVPSGIYLCTMRAGDEKFTRKVTLVK
jgi:hypothetical protein